MAALLAREFDWSLLLEDLDANPYLRDYYSNMPRWGFRTVTAFMVRALTLQDEVATRLTREPICQDWHFAEHYGIYGVHVFDEGIIDERDRQTFEELHGYLVAHAPVPDLTIVLMATPEILLSRVTARRRQGEETVPAAYVEHLVTRYTAWTATLNGPFIVVNTGAEDVIRNQVAAARLVRQVEVALR
ncbi:MAG: deoxynucleoside kinase [Pseudonocardiaceae bacterium]